MNTFFVALAFFTRIPGPGWVDHSPRLHTQAAVLAPLIGALVGVAAGLALVAAAALWPLPVAVLLSMLTSIWVTGALHEDGLADVCDGFGGGWQQAHILDIMKDSRLGTFGAVGLVLVLSLKALLLIAIAERSGIVATALLLTAAHSGSRWAAISFMRRYDYLRSESTAKSAAMAERLTVKALLLASAWAVLGTLPWLLYQAELYLLLAWGLALFLAWWLCKRYVMDRLGGYTGDCLGAVQQISELAIYLGVSAVIGSQLG